MAMTGRARQIRKFQRHFEKGKESIETVLRSACMVGAAEERDRALRIIEIELAAFPDLSRVVIQKIIDVPIMEVLGFEKDGKRL